MPDPQADLVHRVVILERRLRIAAVAAALCLVVAMLTALGGIAFRATAAPAGHEPEPMADVLRAHEIDIVDPSGTTRVKLAAPLPAVIAGEQKKTRGGRPQDTMSGILLFDAEGIERSGYATVDRGYSNVLLTLDDKRQQHAMFIAEPTGATTLRLFNRQTNDRVDVAIDKDGPSISMVRRGKEVRRWPAK